MTGSHEVGGSSPPGSTKKPFALAKGFFVSWSFGSGAARPVAARAGAATVRRLGGYSEQRGRSHLPLAPQT